MAKGIMYIDGQRVPFDGETNVLSVIRKAGIEMPTFCYYSDLSVYGACRMCVVEDERGKIETSCSMKPRDGLSIRTNTSRLLKHRRMILELLLASHNCSCTTCEKSGDCRLQELAMRFGVRRVRFGDSREESQLDDSSPAVVRDPSKCILCGDCVRVCGETIGMGIIDFAQRGYNMRVSPAFNRTLSETHCISCGQCSAVCPTGAITVYNQIGKAWRAIHDPKVRTVVQIAPAVRVAVGEAFGLPAGANVLDQLVTALKYMGVDEIYDTTFAADFTTIEESQEFLARLENGGPFPMFTSCCPAWVKYLELENPKYLKHISTCKSPMEMFASIVREHYQEKDAQDGRTTFQIAIMPCTAKKMEAARPQFRHDGKPDVDLVLTTQEIINMIKESGIQLPQMEMEAPDLPFGLGSGSATIYGTTGGVAEAVVRHCMPDKSRNTLRALEYSPLRGNESVREATVQVGDREIHLAVVHGLIHAQELLKEIDAGNAYYDLIEVMTCPGGCVGGAGQPYGLKQKKQDRTAGLYAADRSAPFKRAEYNPVVTSMLDAYTPEQRHDLLHVDYTKKRSSLCSAAARITGRLLRFLSGFPSFFAFLALFVFFLAYQYDFRYDGKIISARHSAGFLFWRYSNGHRQHSRLRLCAIRHVLRGGEPDLPPLPGHDRWEPVGGRLSQLLFCGDPLLCGHPRHTPRRRQHSGHAEVGRCHSRRSAEHSCHSVHRRIHRAAPHRRHHL